MEFPIINEIKELQLIDHQMVELANGLKIYFINAGTQDIVKVDVIFNAGNAYSKSPVIPACVNALLNDGSTKHSSEQISDMIDGLGAFYVPDIQKDYSQTSLYFLNKFSDQLLPLYSEMLNDSIFPESEIEMYKRNMKQRFIVEHEKVNVQSSQAFANTLFGKESIYADNTTPESFDSLSREDVVDFYSKQCKNKAKFVIVSGKIDAKIMDEIIEQFGAYEMDSSLSKDDNLLFTNPEVHTDWVKIKGEQNNQVSLRIGCIAIGQDHPDYWGFSLLNTVLGGYFGSRLNKVLREEKGLTYGVHSHLAKLRFANYFSIHAELNADSWEEAYSSIIDVFNDLKRDVLPDEELDMVRRYLKGNLLQSLDGAFAYSSYLRNSLIYNLDQNRVNAYIQYLDNVSGEELRSLANTYLNEDRFCKVVAGV